MAHITTQGHTRGFLTDAEMRSIAPALFSDRPAANVSDAYQFVNTMDIVNTMRKIGYEPIKVGQAEVRGASAKSQFTRHEVRMMHRDYLAWDKRAVGDVVPQVLVRNSHDRTSSFQFYAGLERLQCSNGLAVSVAELAGLRVLHNDRNIFDNVIEGVGLIREITETIITPQVEAMTRKVLTKAMERDFAEAATFLKFGVVKPEHVDSFLAVRREADEGRALWNVLNRIQENAVRGGYDTIDALGRNVKARPIANIARDVDFNLNLWSLGAKVLELA